MTYRPNAVPAHITINGEPLCQCQSHISGLLNRLGITCGYLSLADARRAKLKINQHRNYRGRVSIVRGPCPEGPK